MLQLTDLIHQNPYHCEKATANFIFCSWWTMCWVEPTRTRTQGSYVQHFNFLASSLAAATPALLRLPGLKPRQMPSFIPSHRSLWCNHGYCMQIHEPLLSQIVSSHLTWFMLKPLLVDSLWSMQTTRTTVKDSEFETNNDVSNVRTSNWTCRTSKLHGLQKSYPKNKGYISHVHTTNMKLLGLQRLHGPPKLTGPEVRN